MTVTIYEGTDTTNMYMQAYQQFWSQRVRNSEKLGDQHIGWSRASKCWGYQFLPVPLAVEHIWLMLIGGDAMVKTAQGRATIRLGIDTFNSQHSSHMDIICLSFSVAVTIHRYLNGRAPPYLSDYCVLAAGVDTRQHLRSANRRLLAVPRYQLNSYGRRAFSAAGPTVWNSSRISSENRLSVQTLADVRSILVHSAR